MAEDPWQGSIQLGRRALFAHRRRRLLTALVLTASILTCVALVAIAGHTAWTARLRHLDWWFVPAVLVAHVAAYAGYLIAHHQIVNGTGSVAVGWRRGAHIGLVGFGAWLIGGGFEVDRHALQSAGLSSADASATVMALGALELALLTPIAWLCAALLLGTPGVSASVSLPWVIGVPTGLVVALGAAITTSRAHEHASRRLLGRAADQFVAGLGVMSTLVRHPRRGPAVLAGIATYWAADVIALWAALRFVGTAIAFPRLIVGYASGYILTRRTLQFAGVVVTEAMLTVSLFWVGVPLATAALAVLIYRLSDFTFTLGAALVSSAMVERTLSFVGALDEPEVE